MLNLTANEQETILVFTEGNHTAQIATHNATLKDAMGLFSQCYPHACSLLYRSEEGRETYNICKDHMALCFFPVLLEDSHLQTALEALALA